MPAFEQLDALLSTDEEQYYATDSFLEAEELIGAITSGDVPQVCEAWKARGSSWRHRFTQASGSITQDVLAPLLDALVVQPFEPSQVLSLMTRLPNKPEQSSLCESLVVFAEKVWHSSPELHRQVQMCTWSCGLSGRVIKALGYKSWKEAGL